jgi:hypothetical protein
MDGEDEGVLGGRFEQIEPELYRYPAIDPAASGKRWRAP